MVAKTIATAVHRPDKIIIHTIGDTITISIRGIVIKTIAVFINIEISTAITMATETLGQSKIGTH